MTAWEARCDLLRGLIRGYPERAGMRQFAELIQAAGAILAFRWHQTTTQAVPMQPAASKVARIGTLAAYLERRRTVYGG